MNRYGTMALNHMRDHCPLRLAAIPDQEGYFKDLGERIAAEVFALEEALAGPAPERESFPDQVGRRNMARAMAEERVLSELVWLRAEDEEAALSDETAPSLGAHPVWDPLIPDVSDLMEAESSED